jgi:hypothetical protein
MPPVVPVNWDKIIVVFKVRLLRTWPGYIGPDATAVTVNVVPLMLPVKLELAGAIDPVNDAPNPVPVNELELPLAATAPVTPALPVPTVTVYVAPVVILNVDARRPPAPPPPPQFPPPELPPPPPTIRNCGGTAGVVTLLEAAEDALSPIAFVA